MSNPDQLSSDLAALRIDRAPHPEGGLRRVAVWILVLAALAALVVWVIYPRLAARLWKTEIEVTQIVKLSPAQAQATLTTTGYVVPQQTAKVGTKVLGRVVEVAVKENQTVAVGDLIARLDDVELRSSLASGEARVAAARARAETARASAAEVGQQVVRERAAVERGVTPKAVLEDLEARTRSVAAEIKAADAEIRAARADVEATEVGRGNLIIRAPIGGRVTGKPAAVGDTLIPGGVPVVEIVDFTSLLVETDVPEARLGDVNVDGICEVVLDAFPRRKLKGQVVEVAARVNRAKATVIVKVRLAETEGVLPDMAARVSFLKGELSPAELEAQDKLVVPATAVTERDGAKVVFVIDEDGRVRQRGVVLGPAFGGGFELVDGPASGTRIVANPPSSLADGQRIKEKKS